MAAEKCEKILQQVGTLITSSRAVRLIDELEWKDMELDYLYLYSLAEVGLPKHDAQEVFTIASKYFGFSFEDLIGKVLTCSSKDITAASLMYAIGKKYDREEPTFQLKCRYSLIIGEADAELREYDEAQMEAVKEERTDYENEEDSEPEPPTEKVSPVVAAPEDPEDCDDSSVTPKRSKVDKKVSDTSRPHAKSKKHRHSKRKDGRAPRPCVATENPGGEKAVLGKTENQGGNNIAYAEKAPVELAEVN